LQRPRRLGRWDQITQQMKKAIREYAEKLICEYGDATYQKAQEAARDAHRQRNGRLESFLERSHAKLPAALSSSRAITRSPLHRQ
jgi:hypothetical protein